MSRKSLPICRRRTELVCFRVTLEERLAIVGNADKAGLGLSAYLRMTALDQSVSMIRADPQVFGLDRDTLLALNRLGVNLNQMTRAANRGRLPPPDAVTSLCEKIEAIIAGSLSSRTSS